jgi:NAD(P)-dependent dehydrogenase (short-subunit alcohol dehydrogenase family)
MGKSLLIAGKNSKLTDELVREARAAGYEVTATLDEQAEDRSDYEGQLRWVRWRRRSPLSARTVVLQAAGFTDGIDAAIVVHSPDAAREPLHELQSATLEQAVDGSVKGPLFMLRELLGHFQKKGGGSLSLVLYQPDGEVTAPLDACTAGSFQAVAGGLFTYYRNEPVTLRGFSAGEPQPAEFAAYVIGTIDEGKGAGKWNRFSAKGLFSRARLR